MPNPAFRAVPGDLPGHTVLFCRSVDEEYLAYDLNASAHRVWQSCAAPASAGSPGPRSVAEICAELGGDLGRDEVFEFLSLLSRKGLVTAAGISDRAYYVRQGA